jgi:hypothetical protein
MISLYDAVTCLDNANLVRNIHGLIVGAQMDKCFLLTVRADERIDALDFNVVHLFHTSLNLILVRARITKEYQGVIFFDFLHRSLGG